jgi:Flp pilus assembly protein TadB
MARREHGKHSTGVDMSWVQWLVALAMAGAFVALLWWWRAVERERRILQAQRRKQEAAAMAPDAETAPDARLFSTRTDIAERDDALKR